MLFKLSNLNSNLALTLGYLNPALNNSALSCRKTFLLPPHPFRRLPRRLDSYYTNYTVRHNMYLF